MIDALKILGGRIAPTGALIATALGAALWPRHTGGPRPSVLFAVCGLAQLGMALALRARGSRHRNCSFGAAVAPSPALQLGALRLPSMQGCSAPRP